MSFFFNVFLINTVDIVLISSYTITRSLTLSLPFHMVRKHPLDEDICTYLPS